MRAFIILLALLFKSFLIFGQPSETFTQKRFNTIKSVVQPEIIQLPDSVIFFPITGLTYIRTIPPSMISAAYTEIELWIVDAKGKVIYNNIIATKNQGDALLDADYCRYMKLQRKYLLDQRQVAYNPPIY